MEAASVLCGGLGAAMRRPRGRGGRSAWASEGAHLGGGYSPGDQLGPGGARAGGACGAGRDGAVRWSAGHGCAGVPVPGGRAHLGAGIGRRRAGYKCGPGSFQRRRGGCAGCAAVGLFSAPKCGANGVPEAGGRGSTRTSRLPGAGWARGRRPRHAGQTAGPSRPRALRSRVRAPASRAANRGAGGAVARGRRHDIWGRACPAAGSAADGGPALM
jgi:hypothetical protein